MQGLQQYACTALKFPEGNKIVAALENEGLYTGKSIFEWNIYTLNTRFDLSTEERGILIILPTEILTIRVNS